MNNYKQKYLDLYDKYSIYIFILIIILVIDFLFMLVLLFKDNLFPIEFMVMMLLTVILGGIIPYYFIKKDYDDLENAKLFGRLGFYSIVPFLAVYYIKIIIYFVF